MTSQRELAASELVAMERALRQGWNLPETTTPPSDWDDLRAALARQVAFLLRHDSQRLLTALYLLDVSEDRFREAQSGKTTTESATALADIILEREREKLASRQHYKRAGSIDLGAEEPPDT